jgi:hypothetical protein
MGIGGCFPRDKAAGMWSKPLINQLIPRSRRSGAMHPFPHMPSWRTCGQLLLCLSSTSSHRNNNTVWAADSYSPSQQIPEFNETDVLNKLGAGLSDVWGTRSVHLDWCRERVGVWLLMGRCLTARPKGIWGAEL